MKYIYILLFGAILFTACEEKEVVIPDLVRVETDKVILIEELTGVRCPNCPTGSAELEKISDLNEGNVVVIAHHGIDLTNPLDASKYDFRNDDAADIETYLKPFVGKPVAYFNRIKFPFLIENGSWGHPNVGQWLSFAEGELEKPATTKLTITKEYDPATRALNVTVTALPLTDIDGEISVSIMMLESHIIDAQDNQNTIILDYEHNHVMRDAITKFNGDSFSDGLRNDVAVSKSYTYTIPVGTADNGGVGLWQEENLDIVAFIANTEGENNEILQAAKVKLID